MAKQEPRGKRRVFSAESKLEAVRRIRERRAAGVSLAEISQELEVRRDMLRAWAKQADTRSGPPHGTFSRARGTCRQNRRSSVGSSGRCTDSTKRMNS
jgi:transposase-like protein